VDSLSRIFYYISAFFSEVLGLVMIVLSAYWAVRFRDILRADVFRELIRHLGFLCAILGFGILPLFVYLLRPKANPWVVVYGSISQALAGFFSGDINFTLPVLLRHIKEPGCTPPFQRRYRSPLCRLWAGGKRHGRHGSFYRDYQFVFKPWYP